MTETTTQWRAVFSYPPSILGPSSDSYGPPRPTRAEAEQDRVPRSEETHGWRSGVQRRTVTPWETVGEDCRMVDGVCTRHTANNEACIAYNGAQA